MPPDSPEKLLFLHVPKTGGTTFRGVLEQVYPDFCVCGDSSIAAIEAAIDAHEAVEILTASAADGSTVFANRELMRREHWGVLRRAQVFAIFREPVAFVVSLHEHIERNLDAERVRGAYQGTPGPAATLEQRVADPLHANLQLAFLLGELPLQTGRPVNADDLERALAMIDAVGLHIGITECFPDLLHLFETSTGKSIPPGAIEHRNASPTPAPALDPALRDQILRANALDLALHRHAKARVAAQAMTIGRPPRYAFTPPRPAAADGADTSPR